MKGKSFDSWRRVGTVLPAVNVYNSRNVDELILVDIEASIKDKNLVLILLMILQTTVLCLYQLVEVLIIYQVQKV